SQTGSGPQLAYLCGDPGIGKTRLAAEFARAAYRSGAIVLAGRCDREQIVPYQPFAEALKHLAVSLPAGTLRAITGSWAPRPEEKPSELHSHLNLVCRLSFVKK